METTDRAVVLGGSIAGLLAARVLAEAYPEVVVVERDPLPDGCAHRRIVPQGRHAHALLARGQEALEELFPGLTAGLVAAGAPAGDMLADVRCHFGGHRFRQGRPGSSCSARADPRSRGTCARGCGHCRPCGSSTAATSRA